MNELVDLRAKVSRDTHTHLTAISLASGQDISEIVRKVLGGWTDQRMHEAETVMRLVRTGVAVPHDR